MLEMYLTKKGTLERTPSPEHGASNNTLSYLAVVSFCNICPQGAKSSYQICGQIINHESMMITSHISKIVPLEEHYKSSVLFLGLCELSWELTAYSRRSAWMSVIISSRPCNFAASMSILKRPLFMSRAHIFPVPEYMIITKSLSYYPFNIWNPIRTT
jgi:hypothetical protein